MYHICIVPSARQLVWGGVWHNWAFVLHSPQLWINHPLFKAGPCILLCLTSAIARTLHLINVYHTLFGGFAAQHTILHIWNYIGALLLAAAHSRPYPGPRHLRARVIGTKIGAYMCECVWLTVWIKRRSDFTEKLHVRFENDIRSINCCWQSNGTQASVKIEKFSLAGIWAN